MAVNKLKIQTVDDKQDNLISSETLTLLENLKLENAARRQSEEDLKRAQAFAKVGQWSHDLKTGKVQWSWLIYKALGLEFGDPRIDADALFLKSIHPDDRKQFHRLYAEPCPAVVEMDYRLVRQDGNITCIYSKGEISFDADGKPDKVFGVDQDVTENRQIQETLRESELFFKESQRAAFIGSYKLDFVSGCWESSEVLDAIFGIGRIYSRTVEGWLELVHPDDREMMERYFKDEVVSQRKTFDKEYRIIRKSDGEIRWLLGLGKINCNAEGNLFSMTGTIQDITGRKQTEEALRESNDLNTSLLRTIPFGMDIVDECGNILFMSEKLQDIFGREAIGKKCWELYRDDKFQCVDCPLLTGINIGKTEIYETDGVMDGRTFQISHTGMLFQGRKAMLEIFQDITERKRGEKELIEAKEKAEESNRLKSAFLNNMSHEIRTPMNAIMGFSDLMLEAKVDEKNSFAEIVHKSSAQLLMVIDDVMLLSRLQSEKLPANITGFRPAELITDVYRMFTLPELKRELALTVSIPVQYQNLVVRSDTDKIKQILTNLVSNAVKYTFNGGVDVGFDMRNGEIEFYVKDTGIGIPEDEQKRIFENFYRGVQVRNAAIGGTGLGLNIARELVELLGGRIGVSSMPGQGARFYFTIPAEQADELHSEKTLPVTVQKDWHNFTILIAEDETDSYLYLELLLKNKVKRIDHAVNGAKAVELALKNRYTLILMDLQMPVMDGIEATRKIKQHLSDIPVIAQTAYVSLMEKERALQSGFDDYISKPVKKADLLAVINRVIKTE
ncbi:MAG: ATP-binding protein [Victivallaceae bacterium]|jgi:PAS domain S-box-containing protein